MQRIIHPKLEKVLGNNTNRTLANSAADIANAASLGLISNAGIPQVSQLAQSAIRLTDSATPGELYSLTPFENKTPLPGVKFPDFRTRLSKHPSNPLDTRLDGASAALRGSARAGLYAAATSTLPGPYSIFNRETTFGLGDPGDPYALRTDFTARSHVATTWKPAKEKKNKLGKWIPTINPIERGAAFRGDKVQVIDFGQRRLPDAMQWKPSFLQGNKVLGQALNKLNLTQDLVKFYFTGPSLQAGNDLDLDDIIVFRANITSLTDSFNAQWQPQQLIGRADPNYVYSGYSRQINLDFSIYATDRDEVKPIWRKLNALASYTAPEYSDKSIGLVGPWMRFTLGDLFVQQPIFIDTLYYTLSDSETTWEINIEDDPTMMQVPKKIEVNMGITIVTDELPQKGGRMYSLAKQFDEYGYSKDGSDNWLSGFESSKPIGIGGIVGSAEVATPPGTSTTEQSFEVQKEKIVEKKG
jgi:hypothetical protein